MAQHGMVHSMQSSCRAVRVPCVVPCGTPGTLCSTPGTLDSTHRCPNTLYTSTIPYMPHTCTSLYISCRSVTLALSAKGGTQRMRPWHAQSWQPHSNGNESPWVRCGPYVSCILILLPSCTALTHRLLAENYIATVTFQTQRALLGF